MAEILFSRYIVVWNSGGWSALFAGIHILNLYIWHLREKSNYEFGSLIALLAEFIEGEYSEFFIEHPVS